MERPRSGGRFCNKKKLEVHEKRTKSLKTGLSKPVEKLTFGRRIIDVSYFGDRFDEGCTNCKNKFSFGDMTNEIKMGYCSIFHFTCKNCSIISRISTSSTHGDSNRTRKPYAVNVKAALAMIHAGVGQTHINAIFSTMELPTISGSSLKMRERDVGPVIERSAKRSCSRATVEEVLMTCSGDNQPSLSQPPHVHEMPQEFGENSKDNLTFDEALSILEGIEGDDNNQHEVGAEESTIMYVERARNSMCYASTSGTQSMQEIETERPVSYKTLPTRTDVRGEHLDDDNSPVLTIQGDSCTTTVESTIPHTAELRTTDHNDTSEHSDTHTTPVDISISQDAAWPKRGKGMNSLSGWANIIGTQTKKCLNFCTRNKTCKACSTSNKLGKSVPVHDCRRNWGKSAKAMEPSIQVELHMKAIDEGVRYANVIGDEDSSSIKHIRDQVNSDIEKFSDIHHIKRSISRKLRDLHKSNKQLTEKVQNDFIRNFTYAVHQNNSTTEEDMKKALRSISKHMFGDHTICGPWCRYEAEKENYKHSNLPYGKDLSDMNLKVALEEMLSPFIRNSKTLMTSGTTQPNECLNSVAWSKAPKIRNYGSSESFDFRCAAAVLQYNEGVSYVSTVVQDMDMSPRKKTVEFLTRTDKKRKYQKQYKSDHKQKLRRIELKKERKTIDTISDIKLGIAYEKDCLLNENVDDLDTAAIPDAPVVFEKPTIESMNNITLVFIDLETDRLGYKAEMVQLAACCEGGSFNRFIVPTRDILKTATEKTGLVVSAINGERHLLRNGAMLDTVPLRNALSDFLDWLRAIPGQICLVAHNGNRFDFPILSRHLNVTNMMTTAKEGIYCVIDSLPVTRKHVKDCPSYSLTALYQHIFTCPFDAHNATEDAMALMKIVTSLPRKHFYAEAELFSSCLSRSLKRMAVRNSVAHLRMQLSHNGKSAITDRIAEKIVASCITFDNLKLAHKRDSVNGLGYILAEKVNGKPRVTNRRNIIDSLKEFFNDKI